MRLHLYDCMDLLFVLAQPPPQQAQQAEEMLRREVAAAAAVGSGRHGAGAAPVVDLVFVPGLVSHVEALKRRLHNTDSIDQT